MDKAKQAFKLNKTDSIRHHCKRILDDLIEAKKEYWPPLEKKYKEGLFVH
ncbi:hypothetical protein [Cytobacillus firmus]|nr:hypothetical protein [Cytobacillus firmus]MBX9975338.1 hypothetical protein [Cytobacillus firmus]